MTVASPQVQLVPMNQQEFAAHVENEIRGYAAAHVRAGNWSQTEAPARARAEFDQLLPKGVATPDHFLYTIRTNPGGERVGILWVAAKRDTQPPSAFIYDIEIDPAHQRRGFASDALRAAEQVAREQGLQKIALHVFGYNVGAIALYEKLGYVTTNRMMEKPLT